MKKYLITGSNGLLGQKLVYALVNRPDIQLIATALGHNRLIQQKGYEYIPMDISDKAAVTAVIAKVQPDAIIHTAAMTNVDACETERELCWKLNVTAVENIVNAIAQHSPNTHLVHLSTDFIFDGEKGTEYTEEDKPNPLSYYALSKWEGEKVVQASTISWAIARTIIVYGIVDNMSRSNVILWAKDALTKGQKINVVDDQFRSPTLAEDLADGCIRIADQKAKGIYNLSGKETMSIFELVNRVANFWKLDKALINPSKSDTLNQAAKRPPRTGFIIDKAKRDLGYNPHSFEQGLAILDKQIAATK
jgi:dTDP-4-dehydrorhamnose reductase